MVFLWHRVSNSGKRLGLCHQKLGFHGKTQKFLWFFHGNTMAIKHHHWMGFVVGPPRYFEAGQGIRAAAVTRDDVFVNLKARGKYLVVGQLQWLGKYMKPWEKHGNI